MLRARILPISARRAALSASRLRLNGSAAFTTSAVRLAGKEDKLHTDVEFRTTEIEREKHYSLSKQKEGKGEWNEELATTSESIVKAEKGEVKVSGDTMKKLQEESVKASKISRE